MQAPTFRIPAMSLDPALRDRIASLLAANRVVLFMKGEPRAPRRGEVELDADAIDLDRDRAVVDRRQLQLGVEARIDLDPEREALAGVGQRVAQHGEGIG
jgi:hypothetical protein